MPQRVEDDNVRTSAGEATPSPAASGPEEASELPTQGGHGAVKGLKRVARGHEHLIEALLFVAASLALIVTAAIIYTLVDGTIRFFSAPQANFSEFFGRPAWGSIAGVGIATAAGLFLTELVLQTTRAIKPRRNDRPRSSFVPRLGGPTVTRLALVACTPLMFATTNALLGPLLPGGFAITAGASGLVVGLGLWGVVTSVNREVFPVTEIAGPGTMPRFVTLLLSAILFSGTVVALGGLLGYGSLDPSDFLAFTRWAQSAGHFSIWPLITGTTLIAGGAVLLGGPVGVGAALYLSEFASDTVRAVGKPIVEVLAGVPSIVYGFFALFTISPWIRSTFGAEYYNALSAIVVIAVMILPIIVSMSDDAISSVPRDLRDASLAMGATRWETSTKVILPAASSGVFASVFLGLARALGETMAVFLAAGLVARFHFNPLQGAQTMTGYIAQVAAGDIPPGVGVDAAFAVGLVLFIITYTVNWGGHAILERFQGDYR